MLSILIPTYNCDVTDLVNIIWHQCNHKSFDFEIIIVDDCSTNLPVINNNQSLQNLSFCKYIENTKNIGRTATRDILAKEAKYEWFLFLDADVIPKYDNFIDRFNLAENKEAEVIYGGISYDYKIPERKKILRWKYGKEREEKTIIERLKKPYFIISQNLLIKKNIFIKSNTLNESIYGLDILFSHNLKQQNITIKHIDNPVLHLGLENTSIFLKKSLDAVKTTFLLENRKLIDNNLRPLQKSYLNLKKWNLLGIFSFAVSLVKKKMLKNFHSLNPNLFIFDLYRLQYYIELKLNKNA
jgi:glycosyltransferase involved in cell wall biosynthesis